MADLSAVSEFSSGDQVPKASYSAQQNDNVQSATTSDLRLDLQLVQTRYKAVFDDYEASFGLSESLHHDTARYSMHLQTADMSIMNYNSAKNVLSQDALGFVLNQFSSVRDQLLPVNDSDSEKSGIGEIRRNDSQAPLMSGSVVESKKVMVSYDRKLAVALIGRSDVGKTQLFNLLVGRPLAEKYQTTIAGDFGVYYCNGTKLVFFDTPGNSQFSATTVAQCHNVDIVLLLYTNDKKETLTRIRAMHERVKKINPYVFCVLVNSKIDAYESCDFYQEVNAFCAETGMQTVTSSCFELFDAQTFLQRIVDSYFSLQPEARIKEKQQRAEAIRKHRQVVQADSVILSARSQSIIAGSGSSQARTNVPQLPLAAVKEQ